MTPSLLELVRGLLTGAVAGFASGLLGVSPGGILVPVICIVLGLDQRAAQTASLLCQVPPTSLAGAAQYLKLGRAIPLGAVAALASGFVLGGPAVSGIGKLF